MKGSLAGTARRRFEREFRSLSALHHPHCLNVFDYGELDRGPFFTMERDVADHEDFKSSGGNPVWVRFPPPVLDSRRPAQRSSICCNFAARGAAIGVGLPATGWQG